MAVKFTAADTDYFQAEVTPPVDHEPLTLAAFIRPVDGTSLYNIINLVRSGGTFNDWFGLAMGATATYGAVVAWSRASAGGTELAKDTSNAVNGVWQHSCARFESVSSRTAFKNGVSVGTNTNTLDVDRTFTRIQIGRWGDFTPNWEMDGDIAEVAIWDVALLTSEIASLALGFSPLLIRPSSLVFYAPLIGRDSTERDLIGDVALTAFGSPEHAEHPSIILPAAPFVVPAAAAAAAAIVESGNLAGGLMEMTGGMQ